jgi:hypothetical protein
MPIQAFVGCQVPKREDTVLEFWKEHEFILHRNPINCRYNTFQKGATSE